MSQPLVSIVTPSYNQAEFIQDTLESVKNQTYDTIEHIVIDGGSEDGTIDILREYEDTYDLHWVSEPDNGQSDAINKGFDRAEGEIVAWLNSDDVYFDVRALERVVEHFQRYSDDVIYGDLVHIGKDSTIESVDVHPDFDASKLLYRVLLGQPATFFRGEVVRDEQLRTDLHFCMDYEYWLRLSKKYSFRHVNDVLSGFRVYEEQKSQDRSAMAAELRSVLEEYSYPDRGKMSTLFENGRTELKRWIRATKLTYRFHRTPPELAFEGSFNSIPQMLANIPPSGSDVMKVWKRFRSEGKTG